MILFVLSGVTERFGFNRLALKTKLKYVANMGKIGFLGHPWPARLQLPVLQ